MPYTFAGAGVNPCPWLNASYGIERTGADIPIDYAERGECEDRQPPSMGFAGTPPRDSGERRRRLQAALPRHLLLKRFARQGDHIGRRWLLLECPSVATTLFDYP